MLSGCPVTYKLFLFNNSGFTVELKIEEGQVYTIKNGGEVMGNEPFFSRFSIHTGTTNWIYCTTLFPPREYYQSAKIRVQLEATGEVYVLLPSEDFPLTNFTNQPAGFPLKPIIQEAPK